MVDHGPSDGDLGNIGYRVVGHRVHGHGNHGHGDGVHGDGVHVDGAHRDDAHEDGVHGDGVHGDGVHGDGIHGDDGHEDSDHGDGAHWNYDCEGVYGCHWCQNGGDDILKGATLEELLIETVASLSGFCLLEEVGIQVDVACEDGGNLWLSWA